MYRLNVLTSSMPKPRLKRDNDLHPRPPFVVLLPTVLERLLVLTVLVRLLVLTVLVRLLVLTVLVRQLLHLYNIVTFFRSARPAFCGNLYNAFYSFF